MSTTSQPTKPKRWYRWLLRPPGLAALAVLGYVAWALGPKWLDALWAGVPLPVRWRVRFGFLWAVLAAYVATLALASIGMVVLLRRLRRGRGDARSARWLLLCISCLLALGLLESASAAREWLSRPTGDPAALLSASTRKHLDSLTKRNKRSISLLVVGESSAEGQPFQPLFSTGEVVAWELAQVFRGRATSVQTLATGGATLESMIGHLKDVSERPDAVLIWGGHNEFQARLPWWARVETYYRDDPELRPRSVLLERLGGLTPLLRLVRQAMDLGGVSIPPTPAGTNNVLVDRPAVSAAQMARMAAEFELQLEALVLASERLGALPILVIPPGNEADYEPNRSYLSPDTLEPARLDFARRFLDARALETSDPGRAEAAYRALLAEQPGFAEADFRLGRLLTAAGRFAEAGDFYEKAVDCDGYPQRCPSQFWAAYRRVAARHDVLLIDGRAVLRALSLRGLLGEEVLHDGQHPTFRSFLALASAILEGLRARRAFGWPEGVPVPPIEPAAMAARFGLDTDRWALAAHRAAEFYMGMAYMRYDPSERLKRLDISLLAEKAIKRGSPPELTGLPGQGINPPGLRPSQGESRR